MLLPGPNSALAQHEHLQHPAPSLLRVPWFRPQNLHVFPWRPRQGLYACPWDMSSAILQHQTIGGWQRLVSKPKLMDRLALYNIDHVRLPDA